MSRPSTVQSRNLTLTEELEKLEQSITLTLQEIDHNFSRAHRIVTGSIIPIVQQYAKHSDEVWQGSKFWKQFFEASANVSLSSYEEPAEEDLTITENTQATVGEDHSLLSSSELDESLTASDAKTSSQFDENLEDSLLDSPSVTAAKDATPRAHPLSSQLPSNAGVDVSDQEEASFAEYSSPYESLKEEMDQEQNARSTTPHTSSPSSARNTRTPRNQSSPAIPLSTTQQQRLRQNNHDPLLHRVLDKNYRIGTTPHTSWKKAIATSQDQTSNATATRQTFASSQRTSALDSSPLSPAIAAPELRSEIFGSPQTKRAPRTPGVSVQRGRAPAQADYISARKALFHPKPNQPDQHTTTRTGDTHPSTWNDKLWDSDSDTNDDFGISPPKTMQFHVPQSRLMQTPAKEASKRIVEDLLLTAGAGSATSTLDEFDAGHGYEYDENTPGRMAMQEDDSPSIVRMTKRNPETEEF